MFMRGYAWLCVGIRGCVWVCVGMRGYNICGLNFKKPLENNLSVTLVKS